MTMQGIIHFIGSNGACDAGHRRLRPDEPRREGHLSTLVNDELIGSGWFIEIDGINYGSALGIPWEVEPGPEGWAQFHERVCLHGNVTVRFFRP